MSKFTDALYELVQVGLESFVHGDYDYKVETSHKDIDSTKFVAFINDASVDIYGYTKPDPEHPILYPPTLFEINLFVGDNSVGFKNSIYMKPDNKFDAIQIASKDAVVEFKYDNVVQYTGSTEMSDEEIFQVSTIYDMEYYDLLCYIHDLFRTTKYNMNCIIHLYDNERLTDDFIDDMIEFSGKMSGGERVDASNY